MSKCLTICGGFLLALSLQGGTIIYDSTAGASAGADTITGFGPLYDSFSTGVNSGALSGLELFLNGTVDSGESFSVGLYADSSTTPGTLITVLGIVSDSSLSDTNSLIDVDLTANPILSVGTRYWVGLSGMTSANWSFTADTSGIGVEGEFFSNSDGTFPNDPDEGYQMQVQVSAASVPEPSSLLLGASALVALALFRRRLFQS
jgi:MYXO-CTERM domain-containing protein